MDAIPLLVLGCGIRRDTGKAWQLHDVDQLAIAGPVTKAAFRIDDGEELYAGVRRACRLARSGRPAPVMVEVPANLYLFRHDGTPAFREEQPAAPPLDTTAVARAAELLAAARRPLLYLGMGAAAADVVALAERLEAPVATTFQGKGVFPESHPLFLWPGFGAAGPRFVRDIVGGCDATLAIGCRFGEVATASYGLKPPGPMVHVDIDPEVPGRNFPAALPVVAEAGAFVRALLEHLPAGAPDPALRAEIAAGHEAVWKEWLEEEGAGGVSPPRLLRELQARFGPRAIFTSDSGNGTFLAMECLRLDRPGCFLAPVDYSCMGYAVPAAIGARLACPDAPVVALAGDGAFLMTGLELLTASTQGAPIVVVLLRDRELAQIAQFQQTALGRKSCSTLPDYDVAALCHALGVEHVPLATDADIDSALRRAAELASAGSSVLVETAIDYSRKTYFTRGVVKTNLLRLPWADRLRFVGRALARRLTTAR